MHVCVLKELVRRSIFALSRFEAVQRNSGFGLLKLRDALFILSNFSAVCNMINTV